MQDVPGLAEVLAPDGWPNASSASLGAGDPGRYNCLFGRDSLITALAVLPARPDVAAATLRALAAIQGTREDVTWDEEPGKIVHEVRPGISVARQGYLGLEVPDGELRYYGSADSTPLFLHLLATTGDGALAAELEPAWRAAGRLAAGRAGARRRPAALAPAGAGRSRAAGLARLGRPVRLDVARQRDPARGRLGPRAAGGRRRYPGGGARRAARPRAPLGRSGPRRGRRGAGRRASARRGTPTRWRSTRTTARCAARARSWAGCCGRAPRSPAPPSASSAPDVLTDFGLRTLSDRHPLLRPAVLPPRLGLAVRLVAGLGRAARRGARGHRRARPAGRARGRRADRALPRALRGDRRAGPEVATLSNFVQAWTVGAVWALRNEWDGGAHVVA